VFDLPAWCSVDKSAGAFTLKCAANPTASERRGMFRVVFGERIVVVNVRQSASSPSSSGSRSDSPARERKSAEPFNPGAFYLFTNLGAVDFRRYENEDVHRSRVFGGFGFDVHSNIETRTSFGWGPFLGVETFGDKVNGFVAGIEVRELVWIVKRHLAVPISFGVDWHPVVAGIKKRVAAEFIDEMSESDKDSDGKIDMTIHNFDFTPAIGLQIIISRGLSVYAGYAYSISIPDDWSVRYKIPGKYYDADDDGDVFKLPEKYVPLRDVKESFWGVPGTLRLALKFHVLNT